MGHKNAELEEKIAFVRERMTKRVEKIRDNDALRASVQRETEYLLKANEDDEIWLKVGKSSPQQPAVERPKRKYVRRNKPENTEARGTKTDLPPDANWQCKDCGKLFIAPLVQRRKGGPVSCCPNPACGSLQITPIAPTTTETKG